MRNDDMRAALLLGSIATLVVVVVRTLLDVTIVLCTLFVWFLLMCMGVYMACENVCKS